VKTAKEDKDGPPEVSRTLGIKLNFITDKTENTAYKGTARTAAKTAANKKA